MLAQSVSLRGASYVRSWGCSRPAGCTSRLLSLTRFGHRVRTHSLDHFAVPRHSVALVARFRVTTAVPPPDAGVGFLYVSSSPLIAMKRF
jgi:hypothetical protein